MFKGRATIFGTMNIDGEDCTGVFIEVDKPGLMNMGAIGLYKECVVSAAEELGAVPVQPPTGACCKG